MATCREEIDEIIAAAEAHSGVIEIRNVIMATTRLLADRIDQLDSRIAQLEYPQGRSGNLPSWCKRCGWEIDGDRHLTDMPGTSGWDDTRRFLPCGLCGREA